MRILVTAGPTREYFDTVRFISNASSGKMGYAIAEAAAKRGHDVTLVSGPVTIPAPNVRVVRVTTAEEMLAACREVFGACDAAIMTAAVCDWKPRHRLDHKAPKPANDHQVELVATPDICATLGADKEHRVVVGFAVQDEDGPRRAEEKMRRKHCDAIILNHPETFASDAATVHIKVGDQPWAPPLTEAKERIGQAVVELVETLVDPRRTS